MIALLLIMSVFDIDRTPIAIIGDSQIVYGEVECDAASLASKPIRLRGRSVDEACRDYEQWHFRFRVTREIVFQTFAREGCALTDADVAPFRRRPALSDEQLRAGAEKTYEVPRALRRVYAGERWEQVWEQDLHESGVTLDDFRASSRLWPTLERLDRYLAKDPLERLVESFETTAREEAMRAMVRRLIESRAAAAGIEYDVAADQFLEYLTKTLPIRTLDPRFRLPAGREVFR